MAKALPRALPPGLRDSRTVERHYLWFENYPQLYAVLSTNEEDFVELRIKSRPEGMLAICRRVAADGGYEVCFGSGYDVLGSLSGLEASIASGKWRIDKPWEPAGSGSGK